MARLARILHSSVAAICIAATLAPGGGLAQGVQAARSGQALEVRVGQAADYSRIEFHWAGGARAASRREGQVLTLRFNRNAAADLSLLKTFPPRWLKSAEARRTGGSLEVVLTLADDADARVGQVDGATFVNLFEAKPAAAAPAAVAAPQIVGKVQVAARVEGSQASLDLDWPEAVAGAVFRRGDTVWAVFDAAADVDLSRLPKATPQFTAVTVLKGPSWTAVRIRSPAAVPLSASGEGSRWSILLGEGPEAERSLVGLGRDREAETPGLSAAVAGATRAIRIEDPEVGDDFIAVTALSPSKGLEERRRFAELDFLPTAHGLVVEPRVQDLAVRVDGDIVRIGRPRGLALSSPTAVSGSIALADGPRPAEHPALVDFERWSALGEEGFYHRYDALTDAALAEALADENTSGPPQVQARMALARFLIGSELAHEAIGVLNLLARNREQMLSDPEFRGLRGAARVMVGRYEEAAIDLASPTLAGDPAAALWRGYIAVKTEQWTDARRAFAQGYPALAMNAPVWRVRFARADAEAAINTGELEVARSQLRFAERANANDEENLATSLMRARLYQAEGEIDRALEIFDLVARAPRPDLATEASLYATKARLDAGKIQPAEAVTIFDALRFRWRGDSVELKTIRYLGDLYLGLGRYREALAVLRSGSQLGGSTPEGVALQAKLTNAFRELFLDGKADGMQPIQAVGLFEDFRELTPIGADGDRMVRMMVVRLVNIDLLDPAAEMLEHQVQNRLNGVAKAEVATDLARIYLMDRQAEKALQAIDASRTTPLPNRLNSERRLLAGRALNELGRYDAAEEMISLEQTSEADDLRAEIAWRRRDWAVAGPAYERRLGERWKNEAKLTADEEARLLRSAISFSLAGDAAAVARLRERFSRYVEEARSPDALRIALAGIEDARLTPTDMRRVMNEGDTFAGWVNRTKQQFRERAGPVRQTAAGPAPTPTPAPRATPAQPPAAGRG